MAIAAVTGNTSANSTSSGASLAGTIATATIAAGTVVFVGVSSDNAATGGASPITGVTDSQGNTYTLIVTATQSPGGTANDGVSTALYVAPVQVPLVVSVDTITASFSPNTTSKTLAAVAFTGSSSTAYSSNGTTGTTSNPGPTYNSAGTATASVTSGDVVVGVLGAEYQNTVANDTDTSNGSWTVKTALANNGFNAGISNTQGLYYKIVTGTGTQTLNPAAGGASVDWAMVWGLFSVQPVEFGYNINQSVARAATR